MSNRSSSDSAAGGCGCLIILLILGLIWIPIYRASGETITATVVKTVIDDGATFFVLQQEGRQGVEIFENDDSWAFLKFDSNNLLMDIEVGQTYEFKIAGWRVPFLSWFRNIIEAELIPSSG
ncbi:MAG TPA: hypothetical protein PKJ26_00535 [Candidatus Woesebacteria bacterium]|nr:hypothetical protein [Candidatus Woesebacteria bacterium]